MTIKQILTGVRDWINNKFATKNYVDNQDESLNDSISDVANNLDGVDLRVQSIETALPQKQDKLVSGTNIKTVNSTSLLGSGNIAVQPPLVSGTNIKTVNNTSLLGSGNVAVQPTLVSGTNIKTINNQSLLGSGNITIQGGGGDADMAAVHGESGYIANKLGGYAIPVEDDDFAVEVSPTITLYQGDYYVAIPDSMVKEWRNGGVIMQLIAAGKSLVAWANPDDENVKGDIWYSPEDGEIQFRVDEPLEDEDLGIFAFEIANLADSEVEFVNKDGEIETQSAVVVPLPSNATPDMQLKLVSGSNIKTINNTSILGSGNINVAADTSDCVKVTSQSLTTEQKTQARTNIDAGVNISTVNVSVDNNTGTPSGTASISGNTLSLSFANLKGATGATGATGPQGPQGPQGNTGASVDYPYELVNNLTTNDPTKGLTAAQGVVIGKRLNDLEEGVIRPNYTLTTGSINITGGTTTAANYSRTSAIFLKAGQKITVRSQGYNYAPIAISFGSAYLPLVRVVSDPGSGVSVDSTYIAPVDMNVYCCVRSASDYDIFIDGALLDYEREINAKINGSLSGQSNVEVASEHQYSFLKQDGTLISTSGWTAIIRDYAINPGARYKISGRVGGAADSCLAVFLDASGVALEHYKDTTGTGVPYAAEYVTAPAGAVLMRVAGNDNSGYPYPASAVLMSAGEVGLKDAIQEKTIPVDMEIGAIASAGTYIGRDNISAFYGKKGWRSPRYFKLISPASEIEVQLTTEGGYFHFFWYDSDFAYLSKDTLQASSTIVGTPPSNAAYFRVFVSSTEIIGPDSGFDIPKPLVNIKGDNLEECFLHRHASSFSILVPVLVSNPDSCEGETGALQDTQTLLSDTGVLALPTTYSPTGTPTRLIIYCHGAGVNYSTGTGTFPSTDLRPELWLAEGYAVMDIEGNPYDNTNAHGDIPAAKQSYIAGYEYVVNKYNIRRDGVLLGGRSMGGTMVFDLLQSNIPIIAACPLAPSINTMATWEYNGATARAFKAQKFGFTGVAPSWTNSNPMSTAEWEYIKANFDKWMKYSPFFGGMTDAPDKDTIFSIGNIGSSASSATEQAIYNDKHFKAKAPVKMFSAKDDTAVNYVRNCALIYKMMVNAGQIVEMRYFPTGGHHFEMDEDYMLSTYTTKYGEVLNNVPVVYAEMLAFWRRFEQGL